MSNAVIKTSDLCKYYPGTKAIDNISFEIKNSGIIIGLLGPNGAGKTTMVQILTTCIPPSSGDAFIYGHSILTERKKVRTYIGYAPQDYVLDWTLTVYDNLVIFAMIVGQTQKYSKNKIYKLLEDFNLSDKIKSKAIELSGGQARRLQLIRALLNEPKILFVDEPMMGLDPVSKEVAFNYMKALRAKNMTIFLTTNEMKEVEELCDEIIFINKGKLIDRGPIESFLKSYADFEVFEIYFDDPPPQGFYENIKEIPEIEITNFNPLIVWCPYDSKFLMKFSSIQIKTKTRVMDIKIRRPGLNDVFINLARDL